MQKLMMWVGVVLCAFAVTTYAQSTVFLETMGTVAATTALAAHEAANGFDNDAYTMTAGGASTTVDVRQTSVSAGYTNSAGNVASGLANIYFSAASNRGFAIEGINVASYTGMTLEFGYRKEVSTSNAIFNVQWSTNAGTEWNSVTVSNLPAEGGAIGWYLLSAGLPDEAASSSMNLRWVREAGSVAMRLDDVLLRGTSSAPPTTNVCFTAELASVNENAGSYVVTVTKSLASGNVSGEIQLSGTAAEGGAADYTISATNFTLNGATTSATFTVTINDDAVQEGAETVILTLANVVGGTVVSPSVFTLTINANDFGPSSIVISQYTETDSGTIPKGIEIWNVSGGDITFDATTFLLDVKVGVNGGVPASVLTVDTGTLAAGDVWVIGTTNMNPDVVEPFTYSGNDSLVMELGGVIQDVIGLPGNDPGTAWTSNGVSTANQNIQLKSGITDGDKDGWTDPSERFEYVAVGSVLTGFGVAPGAPPQTNVSFVGSSASVDEGVGIYDIVITKSLAEGTVTGQIGLGGTAVEGVDYTMSSTNFTLDGATTSVTVTVTVTQDLEFEPAETVILTIANVTGGTVVVPSVFTLTINVSDVPPEGILSFRFTDPPYLQVSTKDSNLNVTDMALSVGVIETQIVTGTYFPNEPYIEETGGWTAEDQATAKNFNFSFQPAAGYQVAVTAISFRAYATSAGPSAFGFDIRDGTATYAVDAPDSTLVEVFQPVAGINGETASINVMIQGWTNGSRATSGTGTFRLDDVVIWGSVTPTGAVSVEPTFTSATLSAGQMVFVFSNEVSATYTLQRSVDLTANPAFTNYVTGITGGSYTQNVVNDGPMSAYRMLKE